MFSSPAAFIAFMKSKNSFTNLNWFIAEIDLQSIITYSLRALGSLEKILSAVQTKVFRYSNVVELCSDDNL